MESFSLAFGVVAPLVVYMFIGGLIRRLGLLSDGTLREMNGMIFKVLIPISLFFDVWAADIGSVTDLRLYLSTAGLILLCYLVTLAICKRTISDTADMTTMVQGIYRSNYVLFGTVISASLAGDAGAAVTAALAVLVVPVFNSLAVILFETHRGGKVRPGKLLLQILKNPLFSAGMIGLAANLINLRLPDFLYKPLNTLGDLASPIALVILGGMLSFKSIVSHRKKLVAAVCCRLVLIPAVCLGIMIALGFRNETLVALLAVFASPTAVASAPMAQSMGGNGVLAGEIVALTTAGSILTVFLFIAAMSGAGLI